MPRPVVALVKGSDPFQMVDQGLRLLGGLNSIIKPNMKIFLKPNLCAIKTWKTGSTTDPQVIEAFVNLINDKTKDITIVESNHGGIDADLSFRVLGYKELAEKLDIKLLNVSRGKLVEIENPNALFLKKVKLHEELLDCEAMINFPVLKTSEKSLVTLSLKNMFGVLPYRIKAKLHPFINEVICDVNTLIKTSLVIVDGRIGMEGNGPVNGEPVKMDLMIFGTDPVAVDSIGTKIMGFKPENVPHIRLAEEKGIGSTKEITVIGEKLEKVQRKFRPAGKISYGWKLRYGVQENKLTSPLINVVARVLAGYRKMKLKRVSS